MIDFAKLSAIYYFHVMNDNILDSIKYLKSHDVLDSILIFADDGHISIRDYIDYVDYIPIIGRCLNTSICNQDRDTPLVQYNLQSALYNSLLGCNDGFLSINDIPIEKRLNHTSSHIKRRMFHNYSRAIGKFNKQDCRNWWYILDNQSDNDNIYDDYVSIHTFNPQNRSDIIRLYKEIFALFPLISQDNRNVVVAPWNEINDIFLDVCYDMNIRYVIHSDVFDIQQGKNLGIPRINLEKI